MKKVKAEKIGVKKLRYNAYISGIQHNNPDGTSRELLVSKLKQGDKLILQRDLLNEFDKNAIKILNLSGRLLGYIPRFVAVFLAKQIDANKKITAKVTIELKIEPGVYRDCKIRISVSR